MNRHRGLKSRFNEIICSADSTVLPLLLHSEASHLSSCLGDSDAMYELMSQCLASASLFHTLTKIESELWEALRGGNSSGLE